MEKKITHYEATVRFKDEPLNETEPSDVIIKVGSFDIETASPEEIELDENVFFYLDSSEEITKLMDEKNNEDFIVLEVEPIYKKLKDEI